MSRNNKQTQPRTASPLPVLAGPPPIEPATATDPGDGIPWYRRCPLCWGGNKGVGNAYSTQGSTRFYKCCQTLTENAPCGHTWTAQVKTEVISVQHRVVQMDGER